MRISLILAIVLLSSFAIYAQTGNNWVFGLDAGITFKTIPPSYFKTKIESNPKSNLRTFTNLALSYSDCHGDLLFYVSDCQVYNSKDDTVKNGNFTFCNDKSNEIHCGALKKHPIDSNQFYIFQSIKDGNDLKLYYSIFDLSANNGKGELVTNSKLLFTVPHTHHGSSWDITLANGVNSKEFWLIMGVTNAKIERPEFYTFKFSSNGISLPIKNVVKSTRDFVIGNIKAISKADKIIASHNAQCQSCKYFFTEFYFDNKTGKITGSKGLATDDKVDLPHAINGYLTPDKFSLSPDESKLYGFVYYFSLGSYLFQIDLDKTANKSVTIIDSARRNTSSSHFGGSQLGPNGKIYIQRSNSNFISSIYSPNKAYPKCKYVDTALTLKKGTAGFAFPSIHDPFTNIEFKVETSCADTIQFINLTDTTQLDSQDYDYFLWEFGDGTKDTGFQVSHAYKAKGKYEVKMALVNTCGYKRWYIDSVDVYQPVSAGFTLDSVWYECQKANIQIKDTSQFANHFSYTYGDNGRPDTSSPNPTHSYYLSDDYTITQIASNENCSDTASLTDTFYLEKRPTAFFPENTLQSGCYPKTISLTDSNQYDTTTEGFGKWQLYSHALDSIVLSKTTDSLKLQLKDTGFYSAIRIAFNNQGCSDTMLKDSIIYVSPRPSPTFTQKVDTACGVFEAHFTASSVKADSFRWSLRHLTNNINFSAQKPAPSFTITDSGDYQLELIASNNYCSDTLKDTLKYQIYPNPKAQFSLSSAGAVKFNPISACPPFSVNFQSNGSYSIENTWIVGDTVLKGQNTQLTFYDTGYHNIKLLVDNGQNCKDSLLMQPAVYVSPVPVSQFSFSDSTACEHVVFSFNNKSKNSTSWQWNFGDGNSARSWHPRHIYRKDGKFNISLIASNDYCSDSSAAQKSLEVIPAVKPEFSLSYNKACTPLNLSVSNSASGNIDSLWFTDHLNRRISGNAGEFVFRDEGELLIRQFIKSTTGCLTTDSVKLNVYEQPDAQFSISDSQVFCHEKAYEFSNNSSPVETEIQDSLLFHWFFPQASGDVKEDSLKEPKIFYSDVGDFEVKMVAQNGLCKDSLIKLLRVRLRQKPDLDFSTNKTEACLNDSLIISNKTEYADSFFWKFGDGSTLITQSPSGFTHKYSSPGEFNIQLIGSSREGCRDTLKQKIKIVNRPQVRFSLNPNSGCLPLEVKAINESKPLNASYEWFYNNTWFSNQAEPEFSILQAPSNDNAIITLKVDNGVCLDSLRRSLKIRSLDSNTLSHISRTTVLNDEKIEIHWNQNQTASEYKLYRADASKNWFELETTQDTFYIDEQVAVDDEWYQYKVIAIDSCQNKSTAGRIGRSILLEATKEAEGAAVNLSWNAYEQWKKGVDFYQIEKLNTRELFSPIVKLNELNYRDSEFWNGELNEQVYRVKANGNETGQFSFSNEVAVPIETRIFVPTAFSPNDDGLNDEFKVSGNAVESYQLRIFNRWGQLLFESDNIKDSWDGSFRGKPSPAGVYMVHLYVTGSHDERIHKKQTVSLIR